MNNANQFSFSFFISCFNFLAKYFFFSVSCIRLSSLKRDNMKDIHGCISANIIHCLIQYKSLNLKISSSNAVIFGEPIVLLENDPHTFLHLLKCEMRAVQHLSPLFVILLRKPLSSLFHEWLQTLSFSYSDRKSLKQNSSLLWNDKEKCNFSQQSLSQCINCH